MAQQNWQNYSWAASCQNQQVACAPSEDPDQPGHLPSLIRVLAVRLRKHCALIYPFSAQRRLWLDWADAQANLSLRCAHRSFCWLCCAVSHMFICTVWSVLTSHTLGYQEFKLDMVRLYTFLGWAKLSLVAPHFVTCTVLLLGNPGLNIFITFISTNCTYTKQRHDTNEPPHVKTTKWLCDQRRLRSAWASTQSDQSLCCALNG